MTNGHAATIDCGPYEHGKRRVVAKFAGQELKDHFDTDSAFQRSAFCTRIIEGFRRSEDEREPIERALLIACKTADEKKNESVVKPNLIRLSEVKPRTVEALWPDRFYLGKLNLLAGEPGVSKSFVSLAIASAVTRGAPWPDNPKENQPIGGVVILADEDDIEDTIVPRLMSHEADLSRIVAIKGIEISDDMGQEKRAVNLATDIEHLRTAIDSVDNCRLCIVDPISAYLGKTDSHKNAEVRAVLTPFIDLAAEKRIAILGITHLRKGEGSAKNRMIGSIAFVAAARSSWLICEDDCDHRRRLMLPIKNNLGPDVNTGLAYRLESYGFDDQPVVCWESGTVTKTADEMLSPVKVKRGPQANERNEAADWLREVLADGPLASSMVLEHAERAGYSDSTVRRAFQLIGGISQQGDGPRSPWQWSLQKLENLKT